MKTGGLEIGHNTEVTQGRKPLAKRLASWSRPLTASMSHISEPGFQEGEKCSQLC